MPKFRQLFQIVALLIGSGILVGAIVFTEMRAASRVCQGIEVEENTTSPSLVSKETLLKLIANDISEPIVTAPLQSLNVQNIEHVIQKHSFVNKSTVYKSWKGILKIATLPRKPIARIIYPNQPGQYIDQDGTLLPLSTHCTVRVPLVESSDATVPAKHLREWTHGEGLLALLTHIDNDPFWKAQISCLSVGKTGKITMTTQVGKQYIEFGLPQTIEKKLSKLKLFYTRIAPQKGWNTYKRVNLEFENQIVCE